MSAVLIDYKLDSLDFRLSPLLEFKYFTFIYLIQLEWCSYTGYELDLISRHIRYLDLNEG